MSEPSVKYRPDIDGLRAFAILPVVWFHSDLPGVPGGFTGVDTFFVISGYLITLIIHHDVSAGTFSFLPFYERRIRRIGPPLLFVILVATFAAFTLLLPYELEEYTRSAIAALAIASNVYFWRSASYFALADTITPLLHTWSLGVEEQFYLLFPAVLLIAERCRSVRPTVLITGAASLFLCVFLTPRSPAAAFYLLPTRAWELMLGAAFAVGLFSIQESLKSVAGIAGIALVVGAALLIHGADPFPGWIALVPAIGAALVIGACNVGPAGTLLAAPPLVYVGRISYSLYLWHWPVFVFMRHWQADPHLGPAAAIGGIVLSFALAAGSYRWIENPARRRSTPYKKVLIGCCAGLSALLSLLIVAGLNGGLPQRLPARVNAIAAGHFAFAPLAHSCTDVGFAAALHHCHIGPAGKPRLLLLGDSHAAAVSEAVGIGSNEPGLVLSQGSCAPSIGWSSPALRGRDPEICRAFMRQAVELADGDTAITTVVLSAHWTAYSESGGTAFWLSAQHLVDRLEASHKRVIVIAGIPNPSIDVPWASAISARFGRPALKLVCSRARVPLRRVTVIDVSAGFCGDKSFELFTDNNHVSRYAGKSVIAPLVLKAFQ